MSTVRAGSVFIREHVYLWLNITNPQKRSTPMEKNLTHKKLPAVKALQLRDIRTLAGTPLIRSRGEVLAAVGSLYSVEGHLCCTFSTSCSCSVVARAKLAHKLAY